jgi:hypothetical protein
MVSFDSMKRRIVSCIAQRGGRATKAEIIQRSSGKKTKLIQTIAHLVDTGRLLQEGKGKKGSPHIFTLIETDSPANAEGKVDCITVII